MDGTARLGEATRQLVENAEVETIEATIEAQLEGGRYVPYLMAARPCDDR